MVTDQPTTAHRCERGARCHAHQRADVDGQQTKLGAVCDRPLCDTCERAARRALDEAAGLYVQLRNHTLVKAAAVRSEMVTASRTHSLPVNGQALHLGEQLWWLLVSWEDEVRRIAKASPRPVSGRREGRQVADAARFLAAHLTAWIAAPVTPFQVTTGRDPSQDAAVEQAGWEAVAALIDWRSTVRKLPGLDVKAPKAVKRYEQRCPACGVRAITHTAGDDLMQCQSCGATERFVPTLPAEDDTRQEAMAERARTMPAGRARPGSDVAGQDARSGRAAHSYEEGSAA